MSELFNKVDLVTGKQLLKVANAADIAVDVTTFDGNLTSSETDLQKALEKIDGITFTTTASGITVVTTNFNKNLAVTDNTVQKCLDKLDDLLCLPAGSVNRSIYYNGSNWVTHPYIHFGSLVNDAYGSIITFVDSGLHQTSFKHSPPYILGYYMPSVGGSLLQFHVGGIKEFEIMLDGTIFSGSLTANTPLMSDANKNIISAPVKDNSYILSLYWLWYYHLRMPYAYEIGWLGYEQTKIIFDWFEDIEDAETYTLILAGEGNVTIFGTSLFTYGMTLTEAADYLVEFGSGQFDYSTSPNLNTTHLKAIALIKGVITNHEIEVNNLAVATRYAFKILVGKAIDNYIFFDETETSNMPRSRFTQS